MIYEPLIVVMPLDVLRRLREHIAPLVEEFHQWKAEEERLQGVIDKLVLQALIEPRGPR